jgi:hypothetical protein
MTSLLSLPILRGDRIGTPYQETSLLYCSDDNTYTDLHITLRARACRLEWAPVVRPEPAKLAANLDIFQEMFG